MCSAVSFCPRRAQALTIYLTALADSSDSWDTCSNHKLLFYHVGLKFPPFLPLFKLLFFSKFKLALYQMALSHAFLFQEIQVGGMWEREARLS